MIEIANDVATHVADFRSAKQYALAFQSSWPSEILLQRPSANSWAPIECYDHLVVVGHLYLTRIRAEYAQHRSDHSAEPPFHHRWYMTKIIQLMEPPYRFTMNTPRGFDPRPLSELQVEDVIQQYITLQDTWIDLLRQHREVPLDKLKISSPVSSLIRMNLSEAYAFVAAHQRRHMWQADQVVNQMEPAL
jgi:hypothetical protein